MGSSNEEGINVEVLLAQLGFKRTIVGAIPTMGHTT